MKFFKNKADNLNLILFSCLSTILIFIYAPIFIESVLYKQLDFQWSPSKLVFEGTNHYEYMLSGHREKIIGSQFGEYLHGLYVLLYPFTLLSWENAKIAWFLFNFILIMYIPFLLCKKFSINGTATLIIIFFFITSNVTKAHMVIGQQSVLILFFLCLPFVSNSRISNVLSGISYLKYSIGYILFFNFLAEKKLKKILYSFIIPLLGLIFYCLITNTNVIRGSIQPLLLAYENHLIDSSGASIMPKNVFILSIFEFLNYKYKSLIAIFISLLINFYFVYKIRSLTDNLQKLSCLLISVLVFFPHYPHNYILILPLLIYSVKNFDSKFSKIYFFVSIYFLYFFRAVEIYIPSILNKLFWKDFNFLISYLNSILLFIVLLMNIFQYKSEDK